MLTKEQFDDLEQALNAIRDEARADLGERDARYIRKVIRVQRLCEWGGRGLIMFGFHPLAWAAGVGFLSVSKILDNMEIGHNILHGQYDWMNDPNIHSSTYEWDIVCDAQSWKRTHNYEHHTYTNILGKDRDYGYDVLRLSDETLWRPIHRFQFVKYFVLSLIFEWAVSLHEMNFEAIERGEQKYSDKKPYIRALFKKWGKQTFKDYVFFPCLALLAGPMFVSTLVGNFLANLIRNLWTSTVIFCGHFPEQAQTFTQKECENESKGHWYYRQMLGSANFKGRKWLHILSGHLSYQVEHHLFPDIPAHRYPEMGVKVEAVAKQFGLSYNTGSFWSQYKTVLKRIWRYSLPNKPRRVWASAK